MSYWAIIRPPNQDRVYWAIVKDEQEGKALEAKIIRQSICDAVWDGQINQMLTREVAEQFGCSTASALHTLQSIVSGESEDKRFTINEEIGGVFISDGSTFTHSDGDTLAQNRDATHSPRHYVWFLT